MTLHFEDKWVWDFWFAQDPPNYHIFYLQAPRALGNPDLRHHHSTIGHAVSVDLIHWEILPDAIGPSTDENAWDSMATWTGSVFHGDHLWYLFYTGINRVEKGAIQRIGLATSKDLIHWEKYENNPVIKIDPQYYELLDKQLWYEQAWRDPWIFECNDKYHALITARAQQGIPDARGVLGHAISDDLINWRVEEPITPPGEFAYLEVPQVVQIGQKWILIFCVEADRYSEKRLARYGLHPKTGTHYMMADHPLGPYQQPQDDVLLGDSVGSYYAGKLLQDQQGKWVLMTSVVYDACENYVGDISNPMPITVHKNGEITVV